MGWCWKQFSHFNIDFIGTDGGDDAQRSESLAVDFTILSRCWHSILTYGRWGNDHGTIMADGFSDRATEEVRAVKMRRMEFHVVLNLRKIIRQCSRRIVTEWGLINIIFCFTICWFQFWKFRSRQSYVYCFHSVVGKYHLNRQGRTIHLTMALTELYPWRHLETEKIGIYYFFKIVYSIRKLALAERE